MPSFDCFLSHNSKDKPAIRALKQALEAEGLRCWLDEEQLRPGLPWQGLLEQGIRGSASVAVCVAGDGLGPWEDEEQQAALTLAVRDQRPVIPVLLPGAPARPELPMFLGNRTWVDLRPGLADAGIANLVWGIAGRAPGSAGVPPAKPTQDAPTPGETAFLDEVFELLDSIPTILLLAQEDRELNGTLDALRARSVARYGAAKALHLAPTRNREASEAEDFATLGRRAGMDPVPQSAAAFESALEARLSAGELLFLLVSALESGSDQGRERLADCLRGLTDFHGDALRVVLVGGEGLAGLKYAQGALSLLSHAEPRVWPEWNAGDLMAHGLKLRPPLGLGPEEALAVLEATGGHPRLLLDALRCLVRFQRGGGTGTDCTQGLDRSPQIESQLVALAQDPSRRRVLHDLLGQGDLGPFRIWGADRMLRRLYWLNLLRPEGVEGQERLVWRCPAVVEIGRRALG